MRFVFIAILMAFSTQASTQEMSYGDLKNLGVEVVLNDEAKNACWTNLTESREYAEEKLRSAGATVSSYPAEFEYLLIVRVKSVRNKALKLCFGSIRVELVTPTMVNDKMHVAQAFGYEAVFMGKQNVNTAVIESLQAFFDDFRAM